MCDIISNYNEMQAEITLFHGISEYTPVYAHTHKYTILYIQPV